MAETVLLLPLLLQLLAGTSLTAANHNISAEENRMEDKLERLPHNCGQQRTSQEKIIGGGPAKPGEFPWMAALGYYINIVYADGTREEQRGWDCGGALITQGHVLTAAHCVYFSDIPEIKLRVVRLGDLNLNETVPEDWSTPLTINYTSTDVIAHREYTKRTKHSDIALINLRQNVIITMYVRPICLPYNPTIKNLAVGENVTIAGWGLLNPRSAPSTLLQKVDVPILEQNKCTTYIPKDSNVIVDKRIICAGDEGKDSCPGDSGSPLMKAEFSRRWGVQYYMVGVVSYSATPSREESCGRAPGAYTRVSHFITWILHHLDI